MEKTLLEKSKQEITRKIYLLVFVVILIISVSILVTYFTQGSNSLEENRSGYIGTFILLFLYLASFPFLKRFHRLFTWLFVISTFFIIDSPFMAIMAGGISIILAALVINPTASISVGAIFSLAGTFFLFKEKPAYSLVWFYEDFLYLYGSLFFYSAIALIVSREFHKAFALYENQLSLYFNQNRELKSAKEKLFQKVDCQERALKLMEEEREKLSQSMNSMRQSLDELKRVTKTNRG